MWYTVYDSNLQSINYLMVIFLLNDIITCTIVPNDKMINDNIIYF